MKRILHTLANAGVKHNGKYLETVGNVEAFEKYFKCEL